MGLDMYLQKANKKERKEAKKAGLDVKHGEGYAVQEVAYWRKANQIRQWFVINTGYNPDDDCVAHKVKKEQLEKLRDDCKAVLADHSKAKEILPTKSGFFFGSTDYDEYYYLDLEDTIKMIDKILRETDFDVERIEYYEWW